MQNRIYPGSATTRAYIQSPSNPLEISTILVKSFTSNEPQRNPFLCVQWLQPRSYTHFLQWIPRNIGPLCPVIITKKLYPLFAMNLKAVSLLIPVIITKKLYPLLAMNPKAVSLLIPVITTKKLYPFLAMNPNAVSLLSPVINQEANSASCNEPKSG